MTRATPYVPFSTTSYWRKPTTGAPHERSAEWLEWLRLKSAYPYVRVASSAAWGIPVFMVKATDPVFIVKPSMYGETIALRLPLGAKPSTGSDHVMVTIDQAGNETCHLWGAVWDSVNTRWTAKGTARYVLSSDGLCKTAGNFGSRGLAPAVMSVRPDEIAAGLIAHRIQVMVPGTAPVAVYPPMCGYEPNRGGIIPEGAVLRLKPDVNLDKLRLRPAALAVATCLRDYGAVVANNDPRVTTLKADPSLYAALPATALANLPWSLYEFEGSTA